MKLGRGATASRSDYEEVVASLLWEAISKHALRAAGELRSYDLRADHGINHLRHVQQWQEKYRLDGPVVRSMAIRVSAGADSLKVDPDTLFDASALDPDPEIDIFPPDLWGGVVDEYQRRRFTESVGVFRPRAENATQFAERVLPDIKERLIRAARYYEQLEATTSWDVHSQEIRSTEKFEWLINRQIHRMSIEDIASMAGKAIRTIREGLESAALLAGVTLVENLPPGAPEKGRPNTVRVDRPR